MPISFGICIYAPTKKPTLFDHYSQNDRVPDDSNLSNRIMQCFRLFVLKLRKLLKRPSQSQNSGVRIQNSEYCILDSVFSHHEGIFSQLPVVGGRLTRALCAGPVFTAHRNAMAGLPAVMLSDGVGKDFYLAPHLGQRTPKPPGSTLVEAQGMKLDSFARRVGASISRYASLPDIIAH